MTEKMETILTCEVAQDLLPLYHDAVVSTETAKKIELHMDTCETCRSLYDKIKSEENLLSNQLAFRETNEIDSKKRFRSFMNKSKKRNILFGIIVGIVCFGFFLFLWIGSVYGYPAKAEDVKIWYEKTTLTANNGKEVDAISILYTYQGAGDLIATPMGNNSAIWMGVWPFSDYHVSTGFIYPMYELDTGEPIKYNSENQLWLHFRDETIILYLDDVAEELGLQ